MVLLSCMYAKGVHGRERTLPLASAVTSWSQALRKAARFMHAIKPTDTAQLEWSVHKMKSNFTESFKVVSSSSFYIGTAIIVQNED